MSYQLEQEETLDRGVKRIVVDEINKSLQTVNEENDIHKTVHTIRKSLKRIRAAIRLIRDEVGESVYQEENTSYRDAGRHLSEIRDATSQIETVDKLAEQYTEKHHKEAFQVLRKFLTKHRDKLTKEFLEKEKSLDHVKTVLLEVAGRIPSWDISEHSFGVIKNGIKKVYERGYDAFHDLHKKKNQTDNAIHDWRKRAKYLRYQLTIIKGIWPEMVNITQKELHTLSDCLGDYHDLAVLEETLKSKKVTFKDAEAKTEIKRIIEEEKKSSKEQALKIGQKIYAEKPKAFVSRLKQYWKSAHS